MTLARIRWVIAQLSPAEIAQLETLMTTTASDPQIVPRPPAAAPALRAADQGVADARYLAVRAGDGASVATLRLAASAIAKAHEWAGHESPCRDPGVRASLRGWGRRLARPQRQAGALTADVLAVIRLTAVQPRAFAAVASRRPRRPPSAPASTWPWWPCYRTGGCVAARRRR